MAQIRSSNNVIEVDFKSGFSKRRFKQSKPSTKSQLTETVAAAETVRGNPWVRLIGKYKDDRTWEGFDAFLSQSRATADRIYEESERELLTR